MNIYLAYDTSCYTTSIAAVNENGQVLASCRKMLPVPLGNRGLRQSEAVFQHISQINEVQKELFYRLENYNYIIKAVGASTKPRNAEHSYMPVFTVGSTFAEHLARSLNVPFVASDHQQGHIYAAKYQTLLEDSSFLGFHVSGGTTELLTCDSKIEIISKTLDISAGQLIDRVGVAMGLAFPSGPYLEELAQKCKVLPFSISSAVDKKSGDCNFSGAETQAIKAIKEFSNEEIAFWVFQYISNTLSKMIAIASQKTNLQKVLLFGGVMSSNFLRQLIIERIQKYHPNINLFFGKNEFSGDNAAGVALYTLEVCKNVYRENNRWKTD